MKTDLKLWAEKENKPLIDFWLADMRDSDKRCNAETKKRERINKRNMDNYKKELATWNKLPFYKKIGKYPPQRPFTWGRLPIMPLYWSITPLLKKVSYEGFLDWQLKSLDL